MIPKSGNRFSDKIMRKSGKPAQNGFQVAFGVNFK
jgi:hypothetical protein